MELLGVKEDEERKGTRSWKGQDPFEEGVSEMDNAAIGGLGSEGFELEQQIRSGVLRIGGDREKGDEEEGDEDRGFCEGHFCSYRGGRTGKREGFSEVLSGAQNHRAFGDSVY